MAGKNVWVNIDYKMGGIWDRCVWAWGLAPVPAKGRGDAIWSDTKKCVAIQVQYLLNAM